MFWIILIFICLAIVIYDVHYETHKKPKAPKQQPEQKPSPNSATSTQPTPEPEKPQSRALFEPYHLTKQQLVAHLTQTVRQLAPIFGYPIPKDDLQGTLELYIKIAGKLSGGAYNGSYWYWYNQSKNGLKYVQANIIGELAERKFQQAYHKRWRSQHLAGQEYYLQSLDLNYRQAETTQVDFIIINQHGIYALDIKSSLSALEASRKEQVRFHANGVANALVNIAKTNGVVKDSYHDKRLFDRYRDYIQQAYVVVDNTELPEGLTQRNGLPVYTIDQTFDWLSNAAESRINPRQVKYLYRDLTAYSDGQQEKNYEYYLLKQDIIAATVSQAQEKNCDQYD